MAFCVIESLEYELVSINNELNLEAETQGY